MHTIYIVALVLITSNLVVLATAYTLVNRAKRNQEAVRKILAAKFQESIATFGSIK